MLLTVLFKFAVNEGFVAGGTPNPAIGIEKFKEEKRDRWVMPEEMPALAKAIDKNPNVYVRAAIWLYLLTGLRKKELLRAKHTDIDWRRGQLRLPDTKSGKAQIARLSAAAIAIMQAIPKVEGNPHLLPSSRKGKHLVDIDRPWREIRKVAKMEDVRIHDLRRTTGSWMTGAGVDLNLIWDALRHADLTTTLTYARLAKDAAREPMEEHGRRIMEAAGRAGPVAIDGGKT